MRSAREAACWSAVCNARAGHPEHSTLCDDRTAAIEARDASIVQECINSLRHLSSNCGDPCETCANVRNLRALARSLTEKSKP